MIEAATLLWNFERDASYVRNLLSGLTHADSLVQPPATGNCINWILGHIVCYRTYTLAICGLPPAFEERAAQRYARDSAPVTGAAADVANLEALLAAYEQSQLALSAYLERATPAALGEVVSAAGFTMPRGDLLTSFMRHESYHAGQFELLREWVLAQRS
jgi:hypothetical protein